jgi:hypothetical protein
MLDGIDEGAAYTNSLKVPHLRGCLNTVGTESPLRSMERRKVPVVFLGIVVGMVDKWVSCVLVHIRLQPLD